MTETETQAPATILPARQWAYDSDGCVYDPETGELYDPADIPDEVRHAYRPIEIINRDQAEDALQYRARIESGIVALQLRLQSVTEGIGAQITQERRRLAYWDFKHESGLIGFARRMLRGKEKTARFDNGKVAFRATPAHSEVIDNEAGVAWMRKWNPAKVKVQHREWVTATDVKEVRKMVEAETEAPVYLPFLVTGEPGESITIDTGIVNGVNKRGK
jgi:hypothetical protein